MSQIQMKGVIMDKPKESVFVRHKDEVAMYHMLLGPVNGALLMSLAILSDVQEMANDDRIRQEVNEAKELIASSLNFLLKS